MLCENHRYIKHFFMYLFYLCFIYLWRKQILFSNIFLEKCIHSILVYYNIILSMTGPISLGRGCSPSYEHRGDNPYVFLKVSSYTKNYAIDKWCGGVRASPFDPYGFAIDKLSHISPSNISKYDSMSPTISFINNSIL